MEKPVIWVLCGLRAGDTAQALELAQEVGGEVQAIKLAFNFLHHVPNWIAGAGVGHVDATQRTELAAPWPDLVIATGKRTARVAIWIKQQPENRTVAVQLGRPRMAFDNFDLIVTTPQYGLPAARNVVSIALPFAPRRQMDAAVLDHWRKQWKKLPRPLIAAAIGAAKFPLRLGASELDEYGAALGALARREGGSVLLFSSPRAAPDAIAQVQRQIVVPTWTHDGTGPGNPYHAALWLAEQFAVTGDSVSMISEMLTTGKALHLYPLPLWPSLRWRSEHGVSAWLAKLGIVSPPRDVNSFVQELLHNEHAGDLRLGTSPPRQKGIESGREEVVRRIKTLLAEASTAGGSSSD